MVTCAQRAVRPGKHMRVGPIDVGLSQCSSPELDATLHEVQHHHEVWLRIGALPQPVEGPLLAGTCPTRLCYMAIGL